MYEICIFFKNNNQLIVPAPSMDTIQPRVSVRLVITVIYATVECSPVILEQYSRLPRSYAETDQQEVQSRHHEPPTTPVDLAEKVHGMYRLLDVVSESGSNGHGKWLPTPKRWTQLAGFQLIRSSSPKTPSSVSSMRYLPGHTRPLPRSISRC